MRGAVLGLVAAMACGAALADETIGSWSVREQAQALTGAIAITATVDSNEALANEINAPEKATLVMRCKEGQLAFYVAWPQVLSHQADSALLDLPETLVLYKLDAGPIKSDWWVISDTGTSAGSFDKLGAPRLFKTIAGAHQLVVRMTGSATQHATFPVDGVDDVASKLEAACGVKPR